MGGGVVFNPFPRTPLTNVPCTFGGMKGVWWFGRGSEVRRFGPVGWKDPWGWGVGGFRGCLDCYSRWERTGRCRRVQEDLAYGVVVILPSLPLFSTEDGS